MENLENITKGLPKKQIFTLKDASRAGVSRYYLNKLIAAEMIIELQKGVFQNNDYRPVEEDLQETAFKAASARLKERGVICLLSALSYYDITELMPSNIWFWVPYPYGVSSLKTIRVKDPDFSVGVEKHDGFSITTIERTLIECFLNPKYVPASESFACLKSALKDKKTTMKKLLATAEHMGVNEEIYPFIEIALSQL
jgi:predicted transcriptional regulator of viral defense system